MSISILEFSSFVLLAPPALVFHLLSYLGVARFHINLRCSESESGDIALHFNPRFDGWDKVVFNAFKDGSWESEEKIRLWTFNPSSHVQHVLFQVKVNGKEFHTFKHRLPVQQVRAIQVEGDVSIQSIIVIGVSPQPTASCLADVLTIA
uniref:Galectin n=1 Tax=Oryzias melastigma TaxID=30732 RepID=A0A3B3CR58_ORYME